MTNTRRQLPLFLGWGAIAGPVGFIAAWVIGGLMLDGYQPHVDAISRLAAVDASTAPLMNGGFVMYGVGVAAAALVVETAIGRQAAVALALNAVLTFGVLATPLDRSLAVDRLHAAFAAAAYVALAAASLLAARHFRRAGWSGAAIASGLVGVITAGSLLATAIVDWSGLFQRVGLTISDAWMMVIAVRLLFGMPERSPDEAPAVAGAVRR